MSESRDPFAGLTTGSHTEGPPRRKLPSVLTHSRVARSPASLQVIWSVLIGASVLIGFTVSVVSATHSLVERAVLDAIEQHRGEDTVRAHPRLGKSEIDHEVRLQRLERAVQRLELQFEREDEGQRRRRR